MRFYEHYTHTHIYIMHSLMVTIKADKIYGEAKLEMESLLEAMDIRQYSNMPVVRYQKTPCIVS